MQFVNPFFLIGLIAIAIPIVVHLFNFRKYKKVYFSNVEFLKELQIETKKHSTLKQYLILATRILTIIFLVMAFAQPFISRNNNSLKVGTDYVSIYIDNSFSMENTTTSGALLDQAKQKAKEIVVGYKKSDMFQLITNDIEGKHFHFVSPEEFVTLVDDVQISASSTPISEILQKQYDFLKSNLKGNRTAYLISDFQISLAKFDQLPNDSTIRTVLVPLKGSQMNNIYIDSISLNAPIFHKGSNITVEVFLKNTGDVLVEKVPVKLFINGKQRALASVDMLAGSTQKLPLHFTLEETGIVNGKIAITDYPIVYDDDFYFSFTINDRIPILSINGIEENSYLHHLFSNDSAFIYSNINDKVIDFDAMNSYSLIVLNELKTIPSGLVQALIPFIKNGGSVVIIPHPEVDASSYSEVATLLSIPEITQFQKKASKVFSINFEHPLYNQVFEKRDDNMEKPTVLSYYKLKSNEKTVKESLITLENGDDMLTVTPLENGKIYLFATPLRKEYTDFVKQALFVPTLYNIGLYSHPISKSYHIIDNNKNIVIMNKLNGKEIIAKLISDDEKIEFIPEIQNIGGKTFLIPHQQIKKAGNYQLIVDEKQIESITFNYDRNESVMSFLNKEELKKNIKNYNLGNYEVVSNVEKPLDKYIKEQNQGAYLWQLFVILSLLMLLIEIILIRFWKVKNTSV